MQPPPSHSTGADAQFRLLADSAPVLIRISGTDGRCTWFNQPWLQFTGRSLEQELGDGWAEGVHADDRERCLQTYVTSMTAPRRSGIAREPSSASFWSFAM
jgi:PAS domain S-box-containing protein